MWSVDLVSNNIYFSSLNRLHREVAIWSFDHFNFSRPAMVSEKAVKICFFLQAFVVCDISRHPQCWKFRRSDGNGGESSSRHSSRGPRPETVVADLAQVTKWGNRGMFS